MTGTPTDEQVGKAYDEWDDPAPWSGPCYCAGFLAGYEAAHRERCPHQKCPGGSLCCCTDQAATRTRVVSTVTELDALPVGSVVMCSDGQAREVMHSRRSGEMRGALRAFNGEHLIHEGRLMQALPASVLYEPEETR